MFSNVITNVADPEYTEVNGLTLNGSIPRGVAIVTKSEYEKIADVMALATPPRFSVGCATYDGDIKIIDIFDLEDGYKVIDTRYFKIKEGA